MNESRQNQRLAELLIDRATVGLSPRETAELLELSPEIDHRDDIAFDTIVAQIQNRSLKFRPLPDLVRSKVIDDAGPYVGLGVPSSTMNPDENRDSYLADAKEFGEQRGPRPSSTIRSMTRREAFAWLAAAASLLIAAMLWFRPPDLNPNRSAGQPAVVRLIESSDEAALGNFLAGAKRNILEVPLARGGDETGQSAAGTVYWDRNAKRGFVKLTDVSVNDPGQEQYQLWVIDSDRGPDDRPNAGVFNIEKPGTNVFAFRSELEVARAQGFAVTVEKRGGVAKSDLSRVTLKNLGS